MIEGMNREIDFVVWWTVLHQPMILPFHGAMAPSYRDKVLSGITRFIYSQNGQKPSQVGHAPWAIKLKTAVTAGQSWYHQFQIYWNREQYSRKSILYPSLSSNAWWMESAILLTESSSFRRPIYDPFILRCYQVSLYKSMSSMICSNLWGWPFKGFWRFLFAPFPVKFFYRWRGNWMGAKNLIFSPSFDRRKSYDISYFMFLYQLTGDGRICPSDSYQNSNLEIIIYFCQCPYCGTSSSRGYFR